ncbi:MAG TPA: glycosyltransferase 87 family protein [Pseudonocardiaceae bacterium]|jgi:alpha-1,2-mannosyltransferase|nr:glycosyltransferase 87 family protein [Pseudonocardiaceae bacterium]
MTLTAERPAQPGTVERNRWRAALLSTPTLVVAGLASVAITIRWLVGAYRTAPRQFLDLDVYRLGAQAFMHGQNMYGTLPANTQGSHLPFLYPPFAAALFSPLALLSWHQMIGGMLLLSAVSLIVTIYLTALRSWPGGGTRGAVLVTAVTLPLSLIAEPVWDTVFFGQINLVLMALVALDCLTPNAKWPRGMLVGVAAAIKLTPAVFILFFLLRKDFRASVTTVISAAVCTGLGFLATFSGSRHYWFGGDPHLNQVSGTGFIGNQSIDGGLGRLGLPQHTQTMLWLTLVAVVGVVSVLAIRKAHRRDNAPLAMVLTAVFGLVASPTSWGHYWIYVIPAIVVMVAVALQRKHIGWLLAATAAAIVVAIPPFFYVAHGGTVLTLKQQFKANAYTVTALILLAAFLIPSIIRWIRRRYSAGSASSAA